MNIKSKILFLAIVVYCCTVKLMAQNLSPDGIWQQIGYGRIIELNRQTIRIYDIVKDYCHVSDKKELADFGTVNRYTKDTLVINHGIDLWLFIRMKKLPTVCIPDQELNKDPRYNFNVFWNTFQEHYASFEVKRVNWDSIYRHYEPNISKQTTQTELYSIFRKMISLLDDAHVSLHVPDSIEKEYNQTTIKIKSRYSKPDEFLLSKSIAELYTDSLRSYNAGMVRYGTINHTIGYIQINAMLMLADYHLPQNLDLKNFFGKYWESAEKSKSEVQRQQEVEGIHALLDSIRKELKDVTAYILDLRFNGGGKDGVALAILNHFSTKETIAFTKKARLGNGFVNVQNIKVIPYKQSFTGPVYVLTSHRTASAAEVLVLGSLSNASFTRIGSTTEGIFSSTLDKTLPNGWEYELSNEVYQDLQGNSYEHKGISPDFKLNYPKDKDSFYDQLSGDVKNKKDTAIELVIELEKKKKK